MASRIRAVALSVVLLATGAGEATALAPPSATTAPAPFPSAGAPVSFPRTVGRDLAALVSAPARADAGDWRDVGLAVAAIGVAGALDASARDRIQNERSPDSDRIARDIRPLGQAGALGLAGAAWIAGGLAHRPGLSTTGKEALESSLFAAGLVTPLLKLAAGRARPDAERGASSFHPFAGGNSFPSGEATEAFAVASVFAAHTRSRWGKGAAWGLAGLVGLERMDLDRHWASDVVAGAAIGAGIGRWVVARHRGASGSGLAWRVAPEPSGAAVVLQW